MGKDSDQLSDLLHGFRYQQSVKKITLENN
jgi:hypothetical protein